MKPRALLLFGGGLVLTFIVFTLIRQPSAPLQHLSGTTMGTITYHVKYTGPAALSLEEVDSLLEAFNQSLSTYLPDSEISQANTTGALTFRSPFFYPVLQRSQEIFVHTKGAFDPTVGPLIQAWGFGPSDKNTDMDSAKVDALLSTVGFGDLSFDDTSLRLPTGYQIDFSAIAKGYAVDIVGVLLEKKGIFNYMVEIGGEVRCRGQNASDKSWTVGIEDPTVRIDEQKILAIVNLRDRSLATSGNYRNYYKVEDRLFAHIVDPRTGFTAAHRLLSASVFAEDCMTADAYATACMVLGLEDSKRLIDQLAIDAILVYQDDDGTLNSFVSEGIAPYVSLNKAKKP